jgi:hypothetical protein
MPVSAAKGLFISDILLSISPKGLHCIMNCCIKRNQIVKYVIETVEKSATRRLMEKVQMQGFRNRGPARRVGSPSEARTNPEERGVYGSTPQ